MSDTTKALETSSFGAMDAMYIVYHMIMCLAMKSCDALATDIDADLPSFIGGFLKPMLIAKSAAVTM